MASERINVVVNGHDLKFWMPIQKELEKSNKFVFRHDIWQGHDAHDEEHSRSCLDWADVLMCEWTMGNAVWYSNNKKPKQTLITRLHAQEKNTVYPGKLNIDNVDNICFVGEHVRREVIEKFSLPDAKTCTIGNFVSSAKYNFPKQTGAEFNLGMIGVVPMSKRMDRAFDLLELLLQKDDRYSLHIKGPSPKSYDWLWARTAEKEYYENLWERIRQSGISHRVIFDAPGDDVDQWLKNIGFILSPSNFESFHMAVAEGMSSGAIPVVWDWNGATEIYSFLQTHKTTESARQFVEKHTHSRASEILAKQSKNYIEQNFDTELICGAWRELLLGSGSGSNRQVASSAPGKNIVVIWLIAEWQTYHRREMIEALAANLLGHIEILAIEPGSNPEHLIRTGMETQESIDRLNAYMPRCVADNIRVARVLDFPPSGSTEFLNALVNNTYGKQSNLLHWIYKPNQVDRLPDGLQDQFVYEIYDEYTREFGSGSRVASMEKLEKKATRHAQHVFFTSEELMLRKKDMCNSYSLVNNGVKEEVFEKYSCDPVRDSDRCLRNSVGYLGNLSDFFNWQLMCSVVEDMPDVDFFFHGGIEREILRGTVDGYVETLENLPNSYFTGRVSREQGAAAIARYDVLIIPFVENDAMDAVNPLKLWEYLAVGRPVISSPMKAISHLHDLISFASSKEEWVMQISRHANAKLAPETIEKYQGIAKEFSWNKLTKDHASVLKSYFHDSELKELTSASK